MYEGGRIEYVLVAIFYWITFETEADEDDEMERWNGMEMGKQAHIANILQNNNCSKWRRAYSYTHFDNVEKFIRVYQPAALCHPI